MSPTQKKKPTKYYVDFENVHGAGLKGIDELGHDDEVLVFYSQAAETFHIEQAIDILNSKARVQFIEIDGGTRNSLDFQLVAALFGTMDGQHEYAIVSGDGGFDAAIKMGQRLELPEVKRITDLTGSTEPPQPKSTRTKRTRQAKTQDQQAKQEGKEVQERQGAQGEQGSEQAVAPQKKAQSAQKKPPATKKPEQPPASNGKVEPADNAPSEEKPTPAAKSGRYSKRKEIKALLADNDVKLDQQQLSAVMSALNGVKNKQSFYQRIVKSEGKNHGLDLYRRVRDYYDAMADILRT